jgi:mono/diheme cytochrome c family protein
MIDWTRWVLRAAGLLTMTLAAAPASAQGTGNVAAGLTSAQRLCAECHSVRPGQASPNTGAPGFERIANTSGMTAAALRVALQTPHRTMPNVMLRPDELDDVVAYILSLQRAR